jgi:hypothetical protein
VVRRLPACLSEEAFEQLPCVSPYFPHHRSYHAILDYYTSKDVGETAAEPTSTAFLTFFPRPDATIKDFGPAVDAFRAAMRAHRFQHPMRRGTGSTYQPMVEMAPIQGLLTPLEPAGPAQPAKSIDRDPEFIEFKSKWEEDFADKKPART